MSDGTVPPQGQNPPFVPTAGEAGEAEKAFVEAGLKLLGLAPVGPTGYTPRGVVIPFVLKGEPMVVSIGPPVKVLTLLAAAMEEFVEGHKAIDPVRILASLLGRGKSVGIGVSESVATEECDCPQCVKDRAEAGKPN